MKYDPRYHSSLIRNLRYSLGKQRHVELSDEYLWKVWEEASGYDCETDSKRIELFIELLDEQSETEQPK